MVALNPRLQLTIREVDVLRAIARGMTNTEAGADLRITEQTVKYHMSNVMRKLGAKTRTDAVWRALRLGIVDPPGVEPAACPACGRPFEARS